jgi:hypothetical protein
MLNNRYGFLILICVPKKEALMKRNILIFSVILLASVFASKSNAVEEELGKGVKRVEHFFGYGESKNALAGHPGHHLDTVEFWEKVQDLLEKNGYDKNSDFYKHAHANLERVEKMHTVKSKAAAKKRKAPARNIAAQKAFTKGKKAGEDHERRLLKKKAENKKKKTTETTETKTPRKKKVKNVVKEEAK